MEECGTCNKVFRHAVIREYVYWTLMLHPNQCFLGRCVVALNRHSEDLLETSHEEKAELDFVLESVRTALGRLFHPDKMNYASLDNVIRHLHMHVIPRYRTPRKYGDLVFEDHNWGAPPWPNEERLLRKNEFEAIRLAILENLPETD